MLERTLLIIKPDAREHTGEILSQLNARGYHIVHKKRLELSTQAATGFYAVHEGAPYFHEHTRFMCSGPCTAVVLEAEDAVALLREFVGATNPAQAEPHTLRGQFGANLPRNAVHASDTPVNAAREIAFFFTGRELGDRLE